FVLIVDQRHVGWIWIPITFSAAGLTLSFIGNVSRLEHADTATRFGHGLAPIAAAAGLLAAMVLLHLIAGDYSALIPAAEPAKKTKTAWQRPWPLFFQAEDGIRYLIVTGVQTCALPI